ncbi:MAG: hypothetical protein AB8H79_04880, partial [Myxococcota bacterium]
TDGHLIVQVRPGSWTVDFDSRHEGPASKLVPPALQEPWPEVEYWGFGSNDQVRAVSVSGPPGIDPARTPMPEEWRKLATYRVSKGDVLNIEELRSGDPAPSPNQLSLEREIWLDLDGRGLTIRDRFTGEMRQGWRLDAQAPMVVGHAADRGQDQVITENAAGQSGVELRGKWVDLVAESRVDARPSVLPAVGWDSDVRDLHASLRLPPGWKLLTAVGVDSLDGSVLDQWSLFDLFFVLLVTLATWRVLDWRMALAMLGGLVLGRHEAGAPMWIWVALLAVLAVAKAVKVRWAAVGGRVGMWLLLIGLAIIVVPWSVIELQAGLFPVLDGRDSSPVTMIEIEDRFSQIVENEPESSAQSFESDVDGVYRRGGRKKKAMKQKLSLQFDPAAKVQTGPGVPAWSWRTVPLTWSGPVTQDHSIRLILLGPWQLAAIAAMRVALFILLGFGFAAAARRLRPPPPGDDPPNTPEDTGGSAAQARAALSASAALLGVLCVLGAMVPGIAIAQDDDPLEPPEAPSMLQELEARLRAGPECRPDCVSVSRASVTVVDDGLRVRATVHSGDHTSWPLPGPAATWVPSRVTVNGRPARALARTSDGHLHVRVEPGVFDVVVEGPLPPGDALTVRWGLVPQRMDWSADSWSLEGRRADGTAEGFVQLTRIVGEGGTEVQRADNLAAWVEVQREIDLGVPWRVQTTVRRIGPAQHPLALRVPLIDGESVNDASYEGQGTDRLVTLARDQNEVSWTSALDTTEQLVLTAPADVPWSENWIVSCSPVFSCSYEGPAPLTHITEDRWAPQWRPWPEQVVTVNVSRPQAVSGATTTLDSVVLVVSPGRRQLEATLTIQARTSQGGTQVITLPQDARLTSAEVGGTVQPLQARDDGTVHVPMQPGSQRIVLAWLQPHPPALIDQVPEVLIGGEAVNATVTIRMPPERWIIGLWGPRWGPVPLYWVYVVLVLVAAPILWRIPGSPLALWQWILLGLGMTQVPVLVPLVVAFWLMAIAWRGRAQPSNPVVFNGVQLGLVMFTVVALLCLYAAVHAGLLLQPDMQVWGNDSSAGNLNYYVDRITDAMPRPIVISAPIWIWRVLMLLWSLWMAASLVMWLRKGWGWMSTGGWYRPFDADDVTALVPFAVKRSAKKTAKEKPAPPPETPPVVE